MLQAAQKQRRKVGTSFESRTYFNIYDVGEIYLLYTIQCTRVHIGTTADECAAIQ